MQRVLTTVTLLGLLVATAAAFVITEHLKLVKSPIFNVLITNSAGTPTKVFSPVCHCHNSAAVVHLRLRHLDRVTVTIVDSAGNHVATLASDQRLAAKVPQHFAWNGDTASRTRAPDGVYHAWVHLAHPRQTFRFLNDITLDTTPPKVLSASTVKRKPVLFAGPGRTVAIRYSFDKPAHALVYLGSRRVVKGRSKQEKDTIKWAGTVGGRPLPAGTYVLSIGAQDVPGNETPAAQRKQVTVVVRHVQLSPAQLSVRAGHRLTVRVKTAAKRYTWRLGQRRGSHRGKVLRLRAPTTPGTYRLVVTENGQSTTAVVRVNG